MFIRELKIKRCYLIGQNAIKDNRGFFSRLICLKELSKKNIQFNFKQYNLSQSFKKGTIRGIHYLDSKKREKKIVKCIAGSIYVVLVDLRKNSKTFGNWISVELNSKNQYSLLIDYGIGHGFQTLKNNSKIAYLTSAYYDKKYDKGIFYKDNFLKIKWPLNNITISKKDLNLPPFK